jgi:hypothetical protein
LYPFLARFAAVVPEPKFTLHKSPTLTNAGSNDWMVRPDTAWASVIA